MTNNTNDKYRNSRTIRVLFMACLCMATLIMAGISVIIMDGYTL